MSPETASKLTDEEVTRESIGCALFQILAREVTGEVFGDELEPMKNINPEYQWPGFRWPILQSALLDLLERPERLHRGSDYFDDKTTSQVETKSDIVAKAFRDTAETAEKLFSSDNPDDWRWGEIHQLTLKSLFAEAGIETYNEGPYLNNGSNFTVDYGPSRENADDFGHTVGPSVRLIH